MDTPVEELNNASIVYMISPTPLWIFQGDNFYGHLIGYAYVTIRFTNQINGHL